MPLASVAAAQERSEKGFRSPPETGSVIRRVVVFQGSGKNGYYARSRPIRLARESCVQPQVSDRPRAGGCCFACSRPGFARAIASLPEARR
jgi:hypothetical protein